MKRAAVVTFATLAAVVAAAGLWRAQPAPPPDGWHAFEGSWTASGTRQQLPTELGRPASIHKLSGAVTIHSGTLARGFAGEAIAYDDGLALGVGRAVWVDARGDQIFSELTGLSVTTARRVGATITGGTGRYSGISGEYAFTWQYVVDAGGGQVQGHTTAFSGKYRFEGTAR